MILFRKFPMHLKRDFEVYIICDILIMAVLFL